MTKRLMLDAGHGFNTAGNRTPDNIREWTLNHAVCNFIVEELRVYNVDIRRSDDRTGATDVALGTRVLRANDYNPHLFISIHHNGLHGTWGTHTGVETYVHTQGTAQDRAFANLVQAKLPRETGLRDRGVKSATFAVLGVRASIPAVLVEGGFMDSSIDHPVITSTNGQRAYARAVAQAVIGYLGLTLTSTIDNSGQTIHIVKSGENLTGIARQYGVTVNAIVQANNITNPNVIHIGQRLVIPSGGTSTAPAVQFFPATQSGGTSLVNALNSINVDSSFTNRQRIAAANGMTNYTGTAAQNTQMLNLLRQGRLIRP